MICSSLITFFIHCSPYWINFSPPLMACARNTSQNLKRVVVGLKQTKCSSSLIVPKFTDCIVKYFSQNAISTQVECGLHENLLLLFPACKDNETVTLCDEVNEDSEADRVLFQHSPECPMFELNKDEQLLSAMSDNILKQGIYVGVAIILESSDSRIMLTQRADHMRSFPKTWVPPGGHLEYDETILQGGLRELYEETGLKLKPKGYKILCLWESVFPVMLEMGTPRNHHVVVYLHIKSDETHNQLLDKIKLDPEEVQACTWLSESNIQALMNDDTQEKQPPFQQWVLHNDLVHLVPRDLPLRTMFYYSWNTGVYTGTQLALEQWLKGIQENHIKNCKV